MKMKINIALVAAASIFAMQAYGYNAVAQTPVDAEFNAKVRAAIMQNPQMILEAAQMAQVQARQAEEVRQAEAAGPVRAELSAQNTPGYVIGNKQGTKTFVEFLDYRCGYCKKAHTEVTGLIGSNKDTRFVIMMMPVLGPQSETLARFAMAAGEQGKFEEANDYLYENTVDPSDAGLEVAAAAIGLNWSKARGDMTGAVVSAKLDAHREYASRLGIGGTPFFITPKGTIPGAPTAAQLAAAVGE